jgi:hypothetical protein
MNPFSWLYKRALDWWNYSYNLGGFGALFWYAIILPVAYLTYVLDNMIFAIITVILAIFVAIPIQLSMIFKTKTRK